MCITGQRHPYKINYKVGFTHQGHFSGLDIRMWSNGGCSLDLSIPIMETTMLSIDNCYRFNDIKILGRVCKTHLPSNTGRVFTKNSGVER
jgi:xanthine dehydrogenase molybdopterin-binding subunit B